MKQILTIIFFIQFIYSNNYAQSDSGEEEITYIKIYSVEWNLKSKLAYTIDNFKDRYRYYFEYKENNLETMFIDYDDCIEKLSSQKIISSDSASEDMIRDYVELYFGKKKKIELFFDYKGNYYFQKKWHSRNDGFYYTLFKYFSNEMISKKLIEEAKKNFKDPLWHKD
ncbi:MAG: hypothetical protein ACT4ON_09805 [Bacteroidota bacterium]